MLHQLFERGAGVSSKQRLLPPGARAGAKHWAQRQVLWPRRDQFVFFVCCLGEFFSSSSWCSMSDRQSKRPRPASAAFSCPAAEFPLAASVPVTVSSCTVPRHHGRLTNEPEDVPYGGFCPDLPCHPPLPHGSSRFEVGDRRSEEEGRVVPSLTV